MTRYRWNLLAETGNNIVQEDGSYLKLMDDYAIHYSDYMIGYSHPMYSDTLNVRDSVEHNTDGSHSTITTTGTITQEYPIQSTSSTTGAFVTSGGVGINQDAYFDADVVVASAVTINADALVVSSDKTISVGTTSTSDSTLSITTFDDSYSMHIAGSEIYPTLYITQTSSSGAYAAQFVGAFSASTTGTDSAATFEHTGVGGTCWDITTSVSGNANALGVTGGDANTSTKLIDGSAAGAFDFIVYGTGAIQTSSTIINPGNTLYVNTSGYLTTTSSDYRLKTNIVDIEYGLDTVLGLNPVSHSWSEESGMGTGRALGFIAQELEKLVPEVVGGGEYKSVDYPKLVAIIIKAIQEVAIKLGVSDGRP